MDKANYVEMQKNFYQPLASQWRPELPHRNHVVGWFEELRKKFSQDSK